MDFKPAPGLDFNKIFVPTMDTTRYNWITQRFVSMNQPVLFSGESGTAKSVTMQNTLECYPSEVPADITPYYNVYNGGVSPLNTLKKYTLL